ncbi:MAG: glycosyltransferase family 2 protein [Muribaculum sp.]|nr:glycosyltransferase family 2 protein [Muribaculaceae bacterium]MCM1081381.1 glycosyltransferase family 2 protein [Muribaculum sp.]
MRSASNIITVVVPVFNRASLVTETLDSIASQKIKPSLIIVDNNSSDNTLQVIKQWAADNRSEIFPISVLRESQAGAAAARNKGLDNVTTPWTLFFDSDDLMHPSHISQIIETIKESPSANLIGWDTTMQLLSGKKIRKRFPDNNHIWYNIFNGIMSTQQYTAKTRLFHDCGGWNSSLRGWDDYELGMRLLLSRPSIVALHHEPTVYIRCQETSITGSSFSAEPDKWEKALDAAEIDFILANKGEYIKHINLKRAVLAGLYLHEKSKDNCNRLMKTVLNNATSPIQRLMLKLACRYTAIGGRGIHHILRRIL